MKKSKIIFLTILILSVITFKGFDVFAKDVAIINVDTPQTRFYGDVLTVSGWSLSNNKNAKIEVYFDGNIINDIYYWYREDVFNVYSSYNKIDNPNPGYTATMDLSNVETGKHEIKVKLVSNSDTLEEETMSVNIFKDKYEGSIDAPDTNVNSDTLHIGGWALSSTSDTNLKLYIDNNLVTDTIERFERVDVSSIKTEYFKSSFNQNQGFDTYVDVSNLSDGKHVVKLELTDSLGKVLYTTNKDINLKKYTGKIGIDSPSSNASLSGEVVFGGWVMSSTASSTLEVKIDDEVISNVGRYYRADVINSITGYGDASSNPLPGFNFSYNLDKFPVGTHKMTVTLKNKNSEVIVSETRDFKVKSYNTRVGIDTVNNNAKISGDSLLISGWVMSETPNASLEIYFDDDLVQNVSRFKRADVTNSIKDCGDVTENPGYQVTYDLSKYLDGKHTVKFVVKNSVTGQILYQESRTINLTKYKATGSLDAPNSSVEGTSMLIGGWMLTDCNDALLNIYLDDELLSGLTRWNRTDIFDVISGYDKKTNKEAGFNLTKDLTTVLDGKHVVKMEVVNPNTNEVIYTLTKNINLTKYETKINFDTPTETGKNYGTDFRVSGWVMSTDSNTTIKVRIDDLEYVVADRSYREDVINSVSGYGGANTNKLPGFAANINVESLKDGNHQAEVVVVDNTTNEVIKSSKREFRLQKYNGKISLDSPYTSIFNNKDTTSLVVGGWALCQQAGSYLKLYIDGVDQNVYFGRYERNDLEGESAYGTKDNNPLAGYNTTINISHLSAGSHDITLKLYSALGEEITTYTKRIQIYDTIYPGIDVSYHNTINNWSQIKNDGITFAMIRIGYRGYTAGSRVEDEQFINNYNGARSVGMKVGVYFFSQAVNYQEGVEEAQKVLEILNKYGITSLEYPIAFDTEASGAPGNTGRADNISVSERTNAALGFVTTLNQAGYKAMIYASKSWLETKLNMLLLNSYDVWLAHYTKDNGTIGPASDYRGSYQIWQYTSKGSISGISGNVDLNLSFYNYN